MAKSILCRTNRSTAFSQLTSLQTAVISKSKLANRNLLAIFAGFVSGAQDTVAKKHYALKADSQEMYSVMCEGLSRECMQHPFLEEHTR